MWKFSYSFRVMAIFYFINWIVAAETIQGGKLFKGGNYSRKYVNNLWAGRQYMSPMLSKPFLPQKDISTGFQLFSRIFYHIISTTYHKKIGGIYCPVHIFDFLNGVNNLPGNNPLRCCTLNRRPIHGIKRFDESCSDPETYRDLGRYDWHPDRSETLS
jgi:hypothetical protein